MMEVVVTKKVKS